MLGIYCEEATRLIKSLAQSRLCCRQINRTVGLKTSLALYTYSAVQTFSEMLLPLSIILLCAIAAARHRCLNNPTCDDFYACCWSHCTNLREGQCDVKDDGRLYGFCHCWEISNSDLDLEEYRDNMLDQHNYYRSKHGVVDLVLDEELNRSAQVGAVFQNCGTNLGY